jgi:hypothetical protein
MRKRKRSSCNMVETIAKNEMSSEDGKRLNCRAV